MGLFDRLLRRSPDPRETMRPAYDAVVAAARAPAWYLGGVPDSIDGRFEMVMAVLSRLLLRLEGEEATRQPSVWLTELFVDDMDGQLRQIGVGDIIVGKHIGRMMAALGGRLGAYREAGTDCAAVAAVLARNLGDAITPDAADAAAARLVALAAALEGCAADALLAGSLPPVRTPTA